MNKFSFPILFLFVFVSSTYAVFQSSQTFTFTASVSFVVADIKITHTPSVEKIYMLGNRIPIQGLAEVEGDQLTEIILYYSSSTGSGFNSVTQTIPDLPDSYKFKLNIPAEFIIQTGLSGGDVYYYIEAKSTQGSGFWKSESNPQKIEIEKKQEIEETVGIDGGKVVLIDGNPDDGETYVLIPAGTFSQPTKVSIKQIYPIGANVPDGNGAAASKKPVVVYEFGPTIGQTGTLFRKLVEISLLYFDFDASPGKVDGTEIDEKKLGIFWWDGFDWRLVGGVVDTSSNTVTAKVKHFSMYAVFPVGELSADDYRPKEKIITPASIDGFNDFATFTGLTDNFEIKIYDITGKKIKTISDAPIWSGENDDGGIVESGVYIYQFKAMVDGKLKLVSGTVAIAK